MLDLNYNISGRNRSILIIVSLLGSIFSIGYYLILYPNSEYNISAINYSVTAVYFLLFLSLLFTKNEDIILKLETFYLGLTIFIFLYNSLVVYSADDPEKYQGIIILLHASLVLSIDKYFYQRIFMGTSILIVFGVYFVLDSHSPRILVLFSMFFVMLYAYLYLSKNAIAKVSTLSMNFERFINNELSGYVFLDKRKKKILYANDTSKELWPEQQAEFLLDIPLNGEKEIGKLRFTNILIKKHHSIIRVDDLTDEQNSIEFYNHIFEENLAGVYETDVNGTILLANDSFARIFGYMNKEEIIGKDVTNFYKNPENRMEFLKLLKKEKHLTNFESEQIDSNGEAFFVLNNIVFNEKKNSLSGIIIDITAKKAIENKLIEEKEKSQKAFDDRTLKLNAIFDGLKTTIVYTLDKNFKITSFNDTANKAFRDVTKNDLKIGDGFFEVWKGYYAEDYFDQMRKGIEEAFNGKGHYVLGKIKENEREFWIESYINPIYSSGGEIREVSLINNDITQKHEYEHQLKSSLEEKDILLKEVHHRVKNNLQVISSILNLQSSFIEEETVKNILSESQNRIKTMSFIHESLYQTKNFAEIHFSEHIDKLLNNLIYSYSMGQKEIQIKKDIDDISLNLDIAIPCGLIVNEIISNSLKHAFEGKEKGEIFVQMKTIEDKIHLKIADNGIGMKQDLDIYESNTLGLQLIITLVEQIDGTIHIENKEGTKILIIFAP
ncbi:MAG: PAS domain S-box protein [Crocinitomicaceae bacterium]|nr:PAS domain S-box protein [Crocinitomicaceae bacterium]